MNVAFIPVRGGSKSIPLKNIKPICGKPLVYWTMRAACGCKYIDKVYVATDSDEICKTVEEIRCGNEADLFAKIIVIGRSEESASDIASTEFVMMEFAHKYDFNKVALVQATSPLLKSSDLDRGFMEINKEGVDSVLSVVPQKRFNWIIDELGYSKPTNYDTFNRPRRQEFKGYLVENGAFYITSRERLIATKNRISGNIKTVEMSGDSFLEIDEPEDWDIIELLLQRKERFEKKIPKIKMFLTDCDGCLTDGGMYYSENGDELKKFNTRDGMGLGILKDRGIITGIVTGERVKINQRRANKLRINILAEECKNKLKTIKRICEETNISIDNVCYVGDDLNDIDAIRSVGYGCCPRNASVEVKRYADKITEAKGGEGVIREIVDELIKLGKV